MRFGLRLPYNPHLAARAAGVVVAGWVVALTLGGFASSRLAFAATVALILLGAAAAALQLLKERRVHGLFPLSLVTLFGALCFQTYAAFGPQHFAYRHEPGPLDWGWFTTVHVLRAADFCDALEEYGVRLSSLRHNSVLSGSILVVMHWVVDLFLLALLGVLLRKAAEAWRRGKQDGADRDIAQDIARALQRRLLFRRLSHAALAGCGVVYLVWAWAGSWHWSDWLLWPLDNALRTIDLGDMFQIFHWRLHGVPGGVGLATLAVVFRLSLGLVLAEHLLAARLKYLKGAGLNVEDVLEALASPNATARLFATNVLRDLSDAGMIEDGLIAPAYAKALAHPHAEVRDHATLSLYAMGSSVTRLLIPQLTSCLDDPDNGVRAGAAERLGSLGVEARGAAPRLVELLHDHGERVRARAARALVRVAGPEAGSAVPRLIEMLGDESELVREYVADALGELGAPAARPAVPRLIELLGTLDTGRPSNVVIASAASALSRIGGPDLAAAIPRLVQLLDSKDRLVRQTAAEALAAVGPEAGAAVSRLIELLADGDGDVCVAAAWALQSIGEARRAVPEQIKRLDDPDADLRRKAAEVLGALGPDADEAVPRLTALCEEMDFRVSKAAEWAIEQIHPR